MIALVIAGIAGRMGQRIYALSRQEKDFSVVYGLESPETKEKPSGVPVGSDRSQVQNADVIIDFTVPGATMSLLPNVVEYGKAMVIGTTGFSAEDESQIAGAANIIPIVKSSNMSLAVNVFFKAARDIAKALPEYGVRIEETHHKHKKDAPSGTALQAGKLIESMSNQKVSYESFREGEVVGDHRIIFKNANDRLELFHHAESRDIFAAGALQAARWVAKQKKPGLYTMQDVLGL